MLKKRILTALILVPLLVAALFGLSSAQVAGLLGAFVLGAAWEWSALSGLSRLLPRFSYLGLVAASMAALSYAPVLPVVAIGVLWWLWSLYELVFFKDLRRGMFGTRAGKLLSGVFVLVPAWLASYHLHAADPRSPAALLFLFVLVWVADSSAYFAGKTWGKTKFAPTVSPGKSVEGLLGAVLAVLILAYACGVGVWHLTSTALALWLAVAVVTTLFSVLGDLVESKAKRIAGVKDSGTLLPGHGGVLDRIDAFTAAAPVFALGSLWLLPPVAG